jgi:hypothetical protein
MATTSVTPASFVATYPAFQDAARFPPETIAQLIDLATGFCSTRRWLYMGCTDSGKTMRDIGIELFVAHWCAMERRNQDQADNGAPPGAIVGPYGSGSVGPGSVQYDTPSGIELEAGHWNLTNYGTRFIKLARMVGAAGIQVGIGYGGPFTGVGAWAGPPIWVPAWFGAV